MTAPDPGTVRAGNQEREQVVAQLNTAFAEGRLDVGELDERVAAAYRAKTLAELVPLTADLPAPYRPAPATPARRDRAAPARRGPDDTGRWAPVAGTFGLFAVNVLIWGVVSLASGGTVYFWPVWVLIPFVFAVVGAIGQGRGHGGGHNRGH